MRVARKCCVTVALHGDTAATTGTSRTSASDMAASRRRHVEALVSHQNPARRGKCYSLRVSVCLSGDDLRLTWVGEGKEEDRFRIPPPIPTWVFSEKSEGSPPLKLSSSNAVQCTSDAVPLHYLPVFSDFSTIPVAAYVPR